MSSLRDHHQAKHVDSDVLTIVCFEVVSQHDCGNKVSLGLFIIIFHNSHMFSAFLILLLNILLPSHVHVC